MRVMLQRVSRAQVEVDQVVVGRIGPGFLVLAGFEASDSTTDLDEMAGKIVRLRIFDDESGIMNRSIVDTGGDVLAVSQFTLYASTRKGNRPSWSRAARGEMAQPLFQQFVSKLEQRLAKKVQTGVFGASMQISLCNDGPVSLFLDSRVPE